jgi:hypothetical protein
MFSGHSGMHKAMVHMNGDHETGGCPMMSGEHEEHGCMNLDIDEMDEDNDGVCDICGMDVEFCEEMQEHHTGMDCHMTSQGGMDWNE